jgi:hypothetical protein
LRQASLVCPTWIQTRVFSTAGKPPAAQERAVDLDAIARPVRDGVLVRGVLLYSLARRLLQPEGRELEALPRAWMEDYARQIERAGMPVQVTP